jgi:hypothetical protein
MTRELWARLRRRGKAAELPRELAEDAIRLGDHAGRLLDDPVLRLAFELIEDDLVRALLSSPPGEAGEREQVYRLVYALREVEARLKAVLGDGRALAAQQAADAALRVA